LATIMRDGQVAGMSLENTTTGHIVADARARASGSRSVSHAVSHEDTVLEVKGLRMRPKLEDISFHLQRGEVLGIAGLLGAGRTELLKAIVGLESFEAGVITLNGETLQKPDYGTMIQRGMGYTPENRKEAGHHSAAGRG
jgi:simple sugar transport system ATP-binding protein